jgi:hypothetical protein
VSGPTLGRPFTVNADFKRFMSSCGNFFASGANLFEVSWGESGPAICLWQIRVGIWPRYLPKADTRGLRGLGAMRHTPPPKTDNESIKYCINAWVYVEIRYLYV